MRRGSVCYLALPLAFLGLALAPDESRATIVFTMDSVDTDFNAGRFFNTGTNTATAETINNNPNFTSLNIGTVGDAISPTGGNGAAFLESEGFFSEIVLTPFAANLDGFTVLEIALTGDATLQLTALDDELMPFFSDPLDLGPGLLRVAAVGVDGQFITQLTVSVLSGDGIESIRQIRFSGADAPPPNPIPEPSTLAGGLLGVALMGGAWLRRKRQVA